MSSRSFTVLLLFYYSSAVHIEKLVIPDVIQSGSTAVLDCQYASAGDQFTLQWLFKSSSRPVYEWKPGYEPVVQGILDGRIDLTYKVSPLLSEEGRAIRITSVDPEMTGDYTCRVHVGAGAGGGHEARLTKTMLVYSPEKDFTLALHRINNSVDVKCDARGFYPQAELTIELNGATYPQQQQRVWRSEGVVFDAESTAAISDTPHTSGHVTCRLQLLHAGYTAMKRELLCFDDECEHNTSSWIKSGVSTVLVMLATLITVTTTRR